jgi:hypothetical protein
MSLEKEKIAKAKEFVQKMAGGINPLNGEQIENDSVLNDPRMVRCLYFIQDVLQAAIDGQLRTGNVMPEDFVITSDEKAKVQFPQGRIGVNEFARCVNKVIDLNKSKKLTGVELNRKLKKMGVLSEEMLDNGKKRTALSEKSHEYGIDTEKRHFNGNEYEMVLFNEAGKKFLLDNLDKIMECSG